MSDVPAKWYPDASRPGFLRYWDGQAWTEHVASDSSYAPPPPPRKRHTGLIIGIVAGGVVLVGIVLTLAIVVATTVFPRIAEPHYAADAPEGSTHGPYWVGFTADDDFESGVAESPSDPLDEADPAECTDLYYTAPESNVGSADYSIYPLASASDSDGGYVSAWARVFDSSDAAKSFLAHTSDMVDECAFGYTIPYESDDGSYTAISVTAADIPTDIESVGWSERSADNDGGPDITLADLRSGNLVVRGSCVAEAEVCEAFWTVLTGQINEIPAG